MTEFKAPSLAFKSDDSQNQTNDTVKEPLVTKKDQITEKAHDPLGVILEQNVVHNTKGPSFMGKQSQLARIHAILKNKGMDSQQVAQALEQIKEVIEN